MQIPVTTQPTVVQRVAPLGKTPHDATLCSATFRNNLSAARAALQSGANPNCRDDPKKGGASPLWYAAGLGNLDLVKLLEEFGADIHDKSEGDTPLHAAASGGHVDICEYLLSRGASKYETNEDGETPAEAARMNGWDECADFVDAWS